MRCAADGCPIGGASVLRIFSKIRHSFKPALFPAPREADAAGKQHRVCALIPGTVLVVAHQRIPSGGKLYPDLVAPPRMQANADETAPPAERRVNSSRAFLTPDRSRFTTYTLFFRLSFHRRSSQSPDSGKPMNHGYVFLYHSAVLHCLGQGGGSLFCAGVNHDAAHIFVKPVDGENLPAQRFFSSAGTCASESSPTGLTQTARS